MPTATVTRRLMKEIIALKSQPPEGIRVSTSDEDMLDVTGIIAGPTGTPYEGGFFRVKFTFTDDFPASPPKCRMITKIFHPNVSSSGEICVNTLKKDWQPKFGIQHILVTVKCLLIYPNPESALDEEAGRELLEDYDSYCSRAKLITSVHATPKTPPPEFDTPSTESSEEPLTSETKSQPTTTTVTKPTTTITNTSPSENDPSHLLPPPPSSKPRSKSASPSVVIPLATPLQPATNATSAVNKASGGMGNATATNGVNSVKTSEPVITKAVKRPASGLGGAENRKKALKRL